MIPGIRKTNQGLKIGTNSAPVVLHAGSVAAAGSGQSTAAALTYTVNNVTDGNGTKAVILPAPKAAGQTVYVYHSEATVGLPVYPHSGGTINGGSANAAVTIEGKSLAIFTAATTTNWTATYVANT